MIRSKLHKFEQGDFESWLRDGFDAYFWEDLGPSAFAGAEAEVARAGDPIEGIAEAANGLSSAQLGRLRRGLADALASLEESARAVPVFEALLQLALILQASEILRVLPLKVGTGWFGSAQGEEPGASLFGKTMVVVAALASPREDALDCLNALIGSPNFDTAYAGIALQALARTNSSALGEHFKRLRRALKRMFDEFSVDAHARRQLAISVLDSVQLPTVVQCWTQLKFLDRQDEHAALDDWFLKALLRDPDPPLGLMLRDDDASIEVAVPPAQHLVAFRRQRPDVDFAVNEDEDGFVPLMSLLREEHLIIQPDRPAPQHTPSPAPDPRAARAAKGFGIDPQQIMDPDGAQSAQAGN